MAGKKPNIGRAKQDCQMDSILEVLHTEKYSIRVGGNLWDWKRLLNSIRATWAAWPLAARELKRSPRFQSPDLFNQIY